MDSIREDKYYPGIQNICEGGVHLKESFGHAPNEGKLIIICHHNNTTTNDSVRKSAKEIATEPSFTTPAKDFLNGQETIATGGVYYYRANKDGDLTQFYAGKARNLFSRAGQKVRISDKDFVILIRKASGLMDENWQTQLEHLMYENLQTRKNVQVENKASVSESLCSLDEKEKIKIFFVAMIECLENLGAWD